MASRRQQTTRQLFTAGMVWLIVLWQPPPAVAGGKEAVAKLSAASFETRVLKGNGWAFVKFFAPWCQHCSEMGPAWAAMADYFKKNPIPGKHLMLI
jgi:thiol-disulfide isomerase/thioredoxin